MKWFGEILTCLAIGVLAVLLMRVGYEVGYTEGQQSRPVACEPKCEFVYRGTKLINVTCPDSLGRLP